MAGHHDAVALPHDHVVNFYDDDDDIVAAVSCFVADGLRGDDTVVVIATEAHRHAVDAALVRDGIDVDGARLSQRYVCLDAADTLSSVMADAVPDPIKVRTVLRSLIESTRDGGGSLRVFGELVALLWDAGNTAGAIELEALWNVLALEHRFSLYCAYAISSLAAPDDLTAAGHVCSHHSHVIAPASYTSPSTRVSVDDTFDQSQIFVPVAEAVRSARQFVVDTLRQWSHEDLVTDASIVTSELATNAVRHANSPFRVSLRRRDSRVEISVHDASHVLPQQRHPQLSEGSGRGLTLIDRLSSEWGVATSAEGKVVWSQFDRATS
jgi:anti-sigma regulatory factor (Ser/Thr protein kinase)